MTNWITDSGIESYDDLVASLRNDLQLDLTVDALPHSFSQSCVPVYQWLTPTLINAWVNTGGGFETAGYLKDPLGFVHLKGVLQGGSSGTTMFVLPVGYRPGATTLNSNGNPSFFAGQVRVDSNGNVQGLYSGSSTTSIQGLSGINFLAEN